MGDIERIKDSIVPILERNDIDFAALFGSYAKGNVNSDSDVDLLVRFSRPKSLFDIAGIEIDIEESLGKEVDLVTEDSLSPYIKDSVIKESKVIYGKR
ncbi:MAG: nucleotidyltransferase family protein [Parcubacteria group bacterium]|nr:nucleotidyltransferase family protein [Parcubacteria group bacterium]